MLVKIIDLGKISQSQLRYVVICPRVDGQWLFVRQKQRSTWEFPGGHIEANELPDKAAQREFYEETGIELLDFVPIFDYYAEEHPADFAFGRVYFCNAPVFFSPPEEFEIGESKLFKSLPQNLTHPVIHDAIFRRVMLLLGLSLGDSNI